MIPDAQALQKNLQQGGLIAADGLSTAALREPLWAAAQALDVAVFEIHCDKARNRSAVLRAVVKAVDFPEYFGGDLEAFFDCLCDTLRDQKTGVLLWFDKLHSGDPALADDAAAILAVCEDTAQFARNNDKIFAYVVEHTGKHPEPEPGIAPTPYAGHGEEQGREEGI